MRHFENSVFMSKKEMWYKAGTFLFWLFTIIRITYLFTSCLGQETAKGIFGPRVKLPPAHLSSTLGRGFILSLLIAERQAEIAMKSIFYSPWFDPTGNWKRLAVLAAELDCWTTDLIGRRATKVLLKSGKAWTKR